MPIVALNLKKNLHHPKKIYTGIPVAPVTNIRYDCVVMVKWILRLCGNPGYRLAGKCRKEFPKKGNNGG